MGKRPIAVVIVIALMAPGCTAAGGTRLQASTSAPMSDRDRTLIAEYVQKLPIGSRIRVTLADGKRTRGTLMKVTAEHIIVQPRTRIPESPVEISIDRVRAVELETPNGSVARAIGIGIASGAGAILGVFLLLAAIYAD